MSKTTQEQGQRAPASLIRNYGSIYTHLIAGQPAIEYYQSKFPQGNEWKVRDEATILIGYDTVWIPAAYFIPTLTNGATASAEEYPVNGINVDQYLFEGAIEKSIQAFVSMPDRWDKTDVLAKVYWDASVGASPADGVIWGVSAGAFMNDDAIDQPLGTEVNIPDAVITVGDMHISSVSGDLEVVNVDTGVPSINDDAVVFQVARKTLVGGDNMVEDAKFLGLKVQYRESPTLGSQWT